MQKADDNKTLWTRHVVGNMDETLIQRCVLCGKVILNYQNAVFLDNSKPVGFSNGDVYDNNRGGISKYIYDGDGDEVIDCTRVVELKTIR